MPSRQQVTELLDAGHSCETAARELQIPPGLAFMLATGRPADSGDVPAPEQLDAERVLPGSSQHLVNPPPFNPTRKREVIEWVRERAKRELSRP